MIPRRRAVLLPDRLRLHDRRWSLARRAGTARGELGGRGTGGHDDAHAPWPPV